MQIIQLHAMKKTYARSRQLNTVRVGLATAWHRPWFKLQSGREIKILDSAPGNGSLLILDMDSGGQITAPWMKNPRVQ